MASIDLLNSNGSLVQSIVDDKKLQKGGNNFEVNMTRNIVPGLYFIKIQTEEGTSIKKMIVIK